MLLRAMSQGKGRCCMQTASKQWVEHMTSEQASFLRELPFTVSIPSHRLMIVHAGFVPNRPIARQDLLEMYTVCFPPAILSLAHQQQARLCHTPLP